MKANALIYFLVIICWLCFSDCQVSEDIPTETTRYPIIENSECDSLMQIYFPKPDTSGEDFFQPKIIGLWVYDVYPAITDGWEQLKQTVADSSKADTCFVYVLVGIDGKAYCPKVATFNHHPEIIRRSLEIVKRLEYSPAISRGKPVLSYMAFPIRYEYGKE